MLHVDVIERSAALSALVPAWRALLGPRPELVATPTWVLSWWRVMGGHEGRRLRVIAARAPDGRLVGLWPLLRRVAIERRAVPFRRLEMLGSGEDRADEVCSDYLAPLLDPACAAEALDAMVGAVVAGRAGSWDDLLVPSMRADAEVTGALADAMRRHGARVTVTPEGEAPFVSLPDSWEAYLSGLPGERRYFVKKSLRDFELWAGPSGYSLERVSSEPELERGLRALAALHEDRWEGGGVFRSPRFTAFHGHVSRELLRGRDGRLDLLLLRARGEAIAALYNFVVGDKTYFYQSGRRTDLPAKVRAGIAIHALAIQRAIAEGQREYDFLKGESQYKAKLATGRRGLVTLRAVRSSAASRTLDAAAALAGRLAQELRARRAGNFAPPAPHG